MSRDPIPPAGQGTVTWRQWFRILAWVLAEPWRYLLTGDEQAAVARYRAACGHAPAAPGLRAGHPRNRLTEREDG